MESQKRNLDDDDMPDLLLLPIEAEDPAAVIEIPRKGARVERHKHRNLVGLVGRLCSRRQREVSAAALNAHSGSRHTDRDFPKPSVVFQVRRGVGDFVMTSDVFADAIDETCGIVGSRDEESARAPGEVVQGSVLVHADAAFRILVDHGLVPGHHPSQPGQHLVAAGLHRLSQHVLGVGHDLLGRETSGVHGVDADVRPVRLADEGAIPSHHRVGDLNAGGEEHQCLAPREPSRFLDQSQ